MKRGKQKYEVIKRWFSLLKWQHITLITSYRRNPVNRYREGKGRGRGGQILQPQCLHPGYSKPGVWNPARTSPKACWKCKTLRLSSRPTKQNLHPNESPGWCEAWSLLSTKWQIPLKFQKWGGAVGNREDNLEAVGFELIFYEITCRIPMRRTCFNSPGQRGARTRQGKGEVHRK